MALPLPDPLITNFDGARRNDEKLAEYIQSGLPGFIAAGGSLPTTPNDGDIVYYVADDTNGIVWAFRYRSASGSSYKWEFIGGPPLEAEVATEESTTSTSYAALATAGPAVALPLAGDYFVSHGYTGRTDAVVGAHMSYDIGGVGAADADSIVQDTAGTNVSVSRLKRKTGLTAVTLTCKYRIAGASTGRWGKRWIAATPIRVG